MNENKTLYTNRLILRTPSINDAIKIYNGWTSDPNVNNYVSWKTHESIDDTNNYIKYVLQEIQNGRYHWVVELKDTNELIGDIAIIEIKRNHSTCEVGYCYGSKYWGNGYATEALRAVLEFMLINVKINLVEAKHYSSNPASGHVMKKAGMKYDAVLRNRRIDKNNNKNVDLVVYSIMKDEL